MRQTDEQTDGYRTVTKTLPHIMRAVSKIHYTTIYIDQSLSRYQSQITARYKLLLSPYSEAEYCDERVCLCVCVCLSVRDHIFGTTRAIFTKFGDLALVWRRSDMLRISGFVG